MTPSRSSRRLAPGGRVVVAGLAISAVATFVTACADFGRDQPTASSPTVLIRGATVVDGTGAKPRRADVRLQGDRIAAVGKLARQRGEDVIRARGLALAPGFIDAHSHADDAVFDHPQALAAVSQGVTTVVVGQDGASQYPLSDFFGRLESAPAAVNLASFAGHNTLREQVLGDDFARPASEDEIARMREMLEGEMRAGALGLGTGLEYDPGIYSTTREVVELAKVAAAHGGRYISHVRSEDRRFWDAIEEILTIGREAGIPVQISHIKLALRSLHGQAGRLLQRLDEARAAGVEVTADIYPYTYWQSTMTVLFPERDFEDLEAAAFAVEEIAAPAEILLARFDPEPGLAGKTLAQIASLRGTDPAATLLDLIGEAEAMRRSRLGVGQEGDADSLETIIAASMIEADIEVLMAWPFTVFGTDGELAGEHPRGYGSFARVIGRYSRERGVPSLEEAVHKMTARAAAQLGLEGRGVIRPGAYADLLLFDPARVLDRATAESPHLPATGIERVWVNGSVVYERGRPSGERPGRVLRRQGGGRSD